ncbi:MAG: AGE family epimerase/isomerase [Mucilaginibacter polytrichastri]|nr:AGE family epimerase/isomerase [Mucilaginibacter polytrichastri]
MMRKTIFAAGLLCAFAACKQGELAEPRGEIQNLAAAGFTSADADTAYAAFNRYFYDPSAKIYYSNSDRNGVAAIWTQAIYFDLAMDVYQRRNTAADRQMISDLYQGNYDEYDGYNWTNHEVWFIWDDMMWWILALARAHQLTGDPVYLEKAIAGFNHVWEGSYDPENGGMYWNFDKSGKNACINYPTVLAAMRLYAITGETGYLDKAKMIYSWAYDNLFDANTGRVADHKIGSNPPGYEDYTYNQGTCIGAALALYKETNETAYLDDAKKAADYTQNSMSTNGILPAEGDFNEQGVLKAIFARYIMQLIQDGGQTQYLPWIRNNINTGWENRDPARNLTHRDYDAPCPTGVIQSYESSSIPTFMQLCPPE